jgi:hypothetical protein
MVVASSKYYHNICLEELGKTKIPWPESARELYRSSDRRSSDKLVSNFADRGCNVVSVKDP